MGFPTWVHVPLLQIPYQSHLDYYYEKHIRPISHIIEKNVCHMLLTVIFNQFIIKAIQVLLIHCFWTKRIHSLGTSQEVTSGKVGLY